ncbi:MAG: hypothetical protein HRF49_12480 [bacterium]|jgi:hypothetical protein
MHLCPHWKFPQARRNQAALLALLVLVVTSFAANACGKNPSRKLFAREKPASGDSISFDASGADLVIGAPGSPGVLPPELPETLVRGTFSVVPIGLNNEFDPKACGLYSLKVSDKKGGKLAEISAIDVIDMRFALFEVRYDASRYSPETSVPGNFLGPDNETVRLVVTSISGVVYVGIARIGFDQKTGAAGSGELARIFFKNKPFSGNRRTSKAPSETDNRVLLLADDEVTARFTERNRGDCDNNGEVGIADITPIALNFNESSGESTAAQNADSDGNGEVGIADITPIALAFLNQISGYRVFRLESATAPSAANFVGLAPWQILPRPTGLTGQNPRPSYTFSDPTAAPGVYYAVAPFDSEGNQGVLSNIIQGNQPSGGPLVTINSPDDGAVVSGVVQITVDVSTLSAVTGVDFFIDDMLNPAGSDDAPPYSFDWNTNTLPTEASHIIRAVATDDQARTGEDSITVSNIFFNLAITPESGWLQSGGTVPVEAISDYPGNLSVEFHLDGSLASTVTSPPYIYYWNVDGASDGPHDFLIIATDEFSRSKQVEATYIKSYLQTLPPVEWQNALGAVGLGPATPGMADVFGAGIQYGTFAWSNYNDLFTMLPTYWTIWYEDTDSGPRYMHDKGKFLSTTTSLQSLIHDASLEGLPQHWIDPQTHSEVLDPQQPLAKAIADFVATAGGVPNQAAYQSAIGTMSLESQRAIAPLFYATGHALTLRNVNLAEMGFTQDGINNVFAYAHGDPSGGLISLFASAYLPGLFDVSGNNFFFAGFRYEALFEGAAYLGDAIDDLTEYLKSNPSFENVSLDISTPAGRVKIAGTGNDIHAAAAPDGHAILIDLGGSDTYNCHAGGTASGNNGVAICLDFGGNDTYNRMDNPDDIDRTASPPNDDTSQQGAGRLGIGVLVDYGGDDTYRSVRLSQGSCVFGVGVLADYGFGNDDYEMEALGQGGAIGGIAILLDEGGADEYTAWQKSQGFGGLMGIGYLIDQGFESDVYYAVPDGDPAKPEYWLSGASYDNKNMSSSQGCGWGARWGWIEDIPTAGVHTVGSGGLGILCDSGGDDEYTCGVFGQGCGFYQGTGLLIDMLGNDTRNGHWYTQGATAHVGVGGLFDLYGDDNYANDASVGVGGAHDWSITWFCDIAGDDIYNAAGLGLASGYSNSFAYFLDLSGADSYSAHGANENTTLGKGNLGDANRPDEPSYGIFLDLFGGDTYDPVYQNMVESAGKPGNGASWIRTVEGTYTNGRGSGLDVD